MDDVDRIFRLLYLALVEIRDEARQINNRPIFHLADLFHNVALDLARGAHGDVAYAEILNSLIEHSKKKACDRWVDDRLQKLGGNPTEEA